MDYWEFAQFLCVIGLPRLREAHLLLSSISVPGDADCKVLDSIERKLSKITTSSRKLTFFKNGALPPELQLTPVADSLSVMSQAVKSHDCSRVDIKVTKTDSQPFSALIPLLCENFQAIVLKICREDRDVNVRRIQPRSLIFRLFELYVIDCVLDEILPFVLPDD